ncbi:MAG: hypothetical protein EON54_22880 [Alcaligenaceae bacterium]|nr:MAG: hypothetical protein EON54_22880 [Alcaligenaceae bacterium]
MTVEVNVTKTALSRQLKADLVTRVLELQDEIIRLRGEAIRDKSGDVLNLEWHVSDLKRENKDLEVTVENLREDIEILENQVAEKDERLESVKQYGGIDVRIVEVDVAGEMIMVEAVNAAPSDLHFMLPGDEWTLHGAPLSELENI